MNHYTMNFQLMEEHNYSLTELDSMIPWEREIYVSMLIKHMQKKAEEYKKV